jgi:hypothetical protein
VVDEGEQFRVKESLRSGELAVSGDQWPTFLWAGHKYNRDDPWKGLLKGQLLISVKSFVLFLFILSDKK